MKHSKKQLAKSARKAVSLLDLTNLNDPCTPSDIEQLCKRAITPYGHVAAICIWKEHVAQAKVLLKGSKVRIATVVNFPHGGTDVDAVLAETHQAVRDGADEIDLVLPWRALKAGSDKVASYMVRAVRKACGKKVRLKVILETGELADPVLIRKASRIAIASGADFIKTSTGKVPVNATPEAAGIMLKEIRRSGKDVGFKPAGGIRTTADTAAYLDLARTIMGKGWAKPATMRFGASSVLSDLLSTLDGSRAETPAEGY